MVIKKVSLEQIYKFLKKYGPWILGFVFVALLAFNIFIYYQYVYQNLKKEPEVKVRKTLINQEKMQKVLRNLEIRQKNLERVLKKEYSDPFNIRISSKTF